MPTSSSHPTAERLRQLLAGNSPAPDQAELLAHLDDCAACQETLEQLAGADPALLQAASAWRRTAYDREAPLQRVLDDLKTNADLTILHRVQDRTTWVRSLRRPEEAVAALGQLDDYEVTEVLGQGGMGLVLRAFDRSLKRPVAIKVLAPDLAGDPVARQRFEREAQAAAAVRHPHVVTIHAVSEANGLPFLVMEYVGGGSLQDYLDRHGPPDWRTTARLGREIAEGLAAAHAHGLIHRDVKPSNILLAEPDALARTNDSLASASGSSVTAKISDFGLARAADDSRLTQTGIVPGTPMYMAPEQALNEPLDERADLFSLGSVLYTLCTGREPFSGGSPVAVLRQVCEATPQPIREINPAIPAWLAAVVERLHAKRPADRFASAAEVAELLRYNLEHPDHPRHVPTSRPAGPQRRRRRLLAGAVAALLLLAAGLALSEALRWTHLIGRHSSDNGLPLRATLRGHGGPVWSVAYAPDGKLLATGSDDFTVRLWDAATGKPEAELRGHTSPVLVVAFAHSGKFLVSGGRDGNVRFWDPATRREQAPPLHLSGNLRRVTLSPDDQTLAVDSSTQGVELWDLASRQVRLTLPGHHGTILTIAFAPDGHTLATGDASGHVRLWDPATGEERASFQGDSLGVRALVFAPDSRTLASAGTGDRDVKVWEVAGQRLLATLAGYENGAQNVTFSPDGRRLATGSRDEGTVRVWDVAAVRLLAAVHAHQGTVWGVAFSPDGRTLATVGEDRLGKLWHLGALTEGPP